MKYKSTLNAQQLTTVDCLNQSIYSLSKIIQEQYLELAFPKYLALFGALHIEKDHCCQIYT